MPPFPTAIHCRGIATAPFADGALALNRDTETFYHLNPPSAFVLERIRNSVLRTELVTDYAARFGVDTDWARRDIDTIVGRFWNEKLVNEQPGAGAGLAESPAPPLLADPAMDRVLSFGGPAVAVICEDADIAELVLAVTAPAPQPDTPPAGTVILSGRDSGFRLFVDGRLQWQGDNRAAARSALLREAVGGSVGERQPAALLHASAVATDDGCVVLAGASGSGKSTLAAGLTAGGGRLVADDLLPLSPAGNTILPVPLAISIKSGSWPHLDTLLPDLSGQAVFHQRSLATRYYWPGPARFASGPVLPTAILFIDRRPAGPTEIRAVPPIDAIGRLIGTGSQIRGIDRGFAAFARFAETCPAFCATYATLDDALDLVRQTAPGSPPRAATAG